MMNKYNKNKKKLYLYMNKYINVSKNWRRTHA